MPAAPAARSTSVAWSLDLVQTHPTVVHLAPCPASELRASPSARQPAVSMEAMAYTDTLRISPLPFVTQEPTPGRLQLGVERSAATMFGPYWGGLEARLRRLRIMPYPRNAPGDDEIVAELTDGMVYWGEALHPSALLVREEPYAVVTHWSYTPRRITTRGLRALAAGQDTTLTLVCGDGGQVARELLGLDDLADGVRLVGGWDAAKEMVATTAGTWAILPWVYADATVQTLPVDGVRLRPVEIEGYPLKRRLWLEADRTLPDAVVSDMVAALHYDPGPLVELVAVGDIMLGRLVGERIEAHGAEYPFQGSGIRDLLYEADIAIGNLECPLSTRGVALPKTYTFRGDPASVAGLTWAGIDLVSLANNHTGDYGDRALLDTIATLDAAAIAHVGAGSTITEALELKVIEANGLRVGFLACNSVPPASFVATVGSPGSAPADASVIADAVRRARLTADVVVVACHWGVEYANQPSSAQSALASALEEAGAELVVGHHPHVVQGLRFGTDTLTAYSLGNFIFDMAVPGTHEGVALRVILDASGPRSVELMPYRVDQSQPRLLFGEEGEHLVNRVLSSSTGTVLPLPGVTETPRPVLTPPSAPVEVDEAMSHGR